MYRHILIATDGSELSARAVEHGVNLASAVGAEVSFLTVTEPFHVFSLNADQIEDTRPEFKRHMEARAEHTLAAAGEVAAAAGISFETAAAISGVSPGASFWSASVVAASERSQSRSDPTVRAATGANAAASWPSRIRRVIRIPGEGLGLDSCAVAKRVGWCAMSRGGEPWRGFLSI